MKRLFCKKEFLTVPNLLSIFRILLLPVIVWLYCIKKDCITAILILLLSGITDVVDGYIARKFNMVSDFGKILDPVADKLTQGVLLICLGLKYTVIYVLVGLFALKEILMSIIGYLIIKRKDSVNSARWYGKLNTVIIYSVIFLLILFPNMPVNVVNFMIVACGISIVASFFSYALFYNKIFKNKAVGE